MLVRFAAGMHVVPAVFGAVHDEAALTPIEFFEWHIRGNVRARRKRGQHPL